MILLYLINASRGPEYRLNSYYINHMAKAAEEHNTRYEVAFESTDIKAFGDKILGMMQYKRRCSSKTTTIDLQQKDKKKK